MLISFMLIKKHVGQEWVLHLRGLLFERARHTRKGVSDLGLFYTTFGKNLSTKCTSNYSKNDLNIIYNLPLFFKKIMV